MKRFRPLATPAIVFLSLLLTVCSNNTRIAGGASETENVTGKLRITLGDSPPPKGVDHLYLDLHAVQVFSDSLGWITASTLDTVVDLVDLAQGTTVVLADTTLPVGSYTQLRVLFGTNNSVTIDGKNRTLGASALADSGFAVPLNFTLAADEEMELYLDIDAAKSVNWTLPVPELEPTLRPYVKPDCGLVVGTVKDQRGNPIRSAIIRAFAGDSIFGSTGSDSSGIYKLILPAVACTLVCEADGFGPSNPVRYVLQIAPGDSLVGKDFRLADQIHVQLGLIYGTVEDSSLKPINGANIQAWAGSVMAASRSTDSAGFYLFALTAGNYVLTCSAPGFRSDTLEIRISAGDSTRLSSFSLKKVAAVPPLSRINGSVRDTGEGPLAAALVRLKRDGLQIDSAVADSLGAFQFTVPAGTYAVSCSVAGYQPVVESLNLASTDSIRSINLVLSPIVVPRSIIWGYVSVNQTSLTGGMIEAWTEDDMSEVVRSDSTGFFTLVLAPGSYRVASSFAGMLPDTILVELKDGDSVNVNFNLLPPQPIQSEAVVTGTVSDTSGKSINSALVTFIDDSGTVVACTTGASGEFRRTLSPGQYSVSCSAQGYVSKTVPLGLNSSDTATVNFGLAPVPVKPAKGLLRGKVLGQNGTPLPGASVRALVFGTVAGATLTDSTGAFALVLPPAQYSVKCTTEGYQPRTVLATILENDTTDLSISMTSVYGLVTGTVVDKKRRPLGFVRVVASMEGEPFASALTDEAGAYHMLLRKGTYVISCSTFAYQISTPETTSVTVRGGDTLRLGDFELRNDLSAGYAFVSGMVRDSRGWRIAGAVVIAKSCSGSTVSQYTDLGGHFRVILAPGKYNLACTAQDYNRSDPESYELNVSAGMEIEDRSFRMSIETDDD